MINRVTTSPLKFRSIAPLLALSCILSLQSSPAQESDLIRKNGIVLKLDAAELIISKAMEKAVEMDLKVNISVVDPGGHLLAFARMDGARPASIYTCLSKAQTAALKLSDTGIIGASGPTGRHAPEPLHRKHRSYERRPVHHAGRRRDHHSGR